MTVSEFVSTWAKSTAPHEPCLLCGRRPHVAAVFVPHRQLHPGGQRVQLAGYTLCRRCNRRPGSKGKAEALLLAHRPGVPNPEAN